MRRKIRKLFSVIFADFGHFSERIFKFLQNFSIMPNDVKTDSYSVNHALSNGTTLITIRGCGKKSVIFAFLRYEKSTFLVNFEKS